MIRKKTIHTASGYINKYYLFKLCLFSKTYIENKRIKTTILGIDIKKHSTFKPLVTVVVPNYNHAKYLKKRLNSIYKQTYKNIEVILLDDCSTDTSRSILSKYAKKHKNNTKTIFNTKNSGGVFYQWARALESARGDFIWIAESDDWCSKNFIKKLLPYFQDESVMIAYSRSVFIKNNKKIWTIEQYLQDIPYNWRGKFVDTTHNLVNSGFAYKNIIPNVSSAIFRNTGFKSILNDKNWYKLKLCGDWIFYLNTAMGGRIAYDASATNYYRQHDKNTSGAVMKETNYFTEHEYVSLYIAKHFNTEKINFEKLNTRLYDMWTHNINMPKSEFKNFYNLEKILSTKQENLNILVASWGFYTGGGETFPIYLANELKTQGHSITFVSYNKTDHNLGIKNLLDKSIPVLYKQYEPDWDTIITNFDTEICYSGHLTVDVDICTNKKPNKCKHFVTLHGMYEAVPPELVSKHIKKLKSKIDKFIYIADKNLKPFKNNHITIDNKFIKLPNGLPISEPSVINRSSLGIPNDAFVMISVSRAIPEKGWTEAIQATTILRNTTKCNAHLILLGDGEMYNKLKDNCPEYIHLLGFKQNTRDYIAMADLFVFPTYFSGESFPLVLIDSIFCNTPVVATNIAEIKNMLTIDDQTLGSVFDLDNNQQISTEKLVECIKKNMHTKQDKQFQKLNSELKKRYDIKNVAKMYQDIFSAK